MKSLKGQLIAAIAMTLVAIVTISSSTYAWFAMNTSVTAKGMEVKAASEGGIVIAPYGYNTNGYVTPASTAYVQEATATYLLPASVQGLYPTSTKNGVNWYHATSASVDSATAKENSYSALTMTATTTPSKSGVTEYTGVASDGNYYFVMNKFAVKSLDETADSANKSLYVKSISVAVKDSTSAAIALDNSLRVAIKTDAGTYFFAPMYSSSSSGTLYCYGITTAGGTASRTAYSSINRGSTGLSVNVANNIAYTDAVPLEVYLYYEGEDENCKSINAVNIDTLTVSINFSTSST